MSRAKRRELLINKCCIRFSRISSNLNKQAEEYNKKHKDKVMEVKSIPSLDNTMYPKLYLSVRKK